MPCIDIRELGIWKELSDSRYSLLADICTLQPANKQRRSVVRGPRVALAEREIGHIVKSRSQNVQRHSEFLRFVVIVRVANEICQKKLADWEGLP